MTLHFLQCLLNKKYLRRDFVAISLSIFNDRHVCTLVVLDVEGYKERFDVKTHMYARTHTTAPTYMCISFTYHPIPYRIPLPTLLPTQTMTRPTMEVAYVFRY